MTSVNDTALLAAMTADEIMVLLLEVAKFRLRHFSAILVRQSYEHDLSALFKNLGISNFTIVSKHSSNNTIQAVKDSDFYKRDLQLQAALYQKFKYDIELYEYARELANVINVIV